MTQLILASQSPRRDQILKEVGFKVVVDPIKISEIIEENLNPQDVCLRISRAKLSAYKSARKHLKTQDKMVVTADTIVAHGGLVFGKPDSATDGLAMLERLSDSTHSVFTALSLWLTRSDRTLDYVEETKVTFRKLERNEIERYFAQTSFMDKAGSYGIQDVDSSWVTRIDGSVANVKGFPIESFCSLLKREGIQLEK